MILSLQNRNVLLSQVFHCNEDFIWNQLIHAHIFENTEFTLGATPVSRQLGIVAAN